MKYYINGDLVKFNGTQALIGEGNETKVYRYEDKVIKRYVTRSRNIIEEDKVVKEILSKLNTKRILMPDDFVYDVNGNYCGYTQKYVNPYCGTVSSIPTDKFYDSFLILSEDFNILSRSGIFAGDCHADNIILDGNYDVYIVDIGHFSKTMFPNSIYQLNGNIIRSIIKRFLLNSKLFDGELRSAVDDYLFYLLNNVWYLDFLKNEICRYDTLGDYQKELKCKVLKKS